MIDFWFMYLRTIERDTYKRTPMKNKSKRIVRYPHNRNDIEIFKIFVDLHLLLFLLVVSEYRWMNRVTLIFLVSHSKQLRLHIQYIIVKWPVAINTELPVYYIALAWITSKIKLPNFCYCYIFVHNLSTHIEKIAHYSTILCTPTFTLSMIARILHVASIQIVSDCVVRSACVHQIQLFKI